MERLGYLCGFCNQRFLILNEIQEHLQNFHNLERNEGQKCGIDNCPAVFRNPSSLRSHRSRIHRNNQNIEVQPERQNFDEIDVPYQLPEDIQAAVGNANLENDNEVVENVDMEPSSDEETDEDNSEEDEDELENEEEQGNEERINDERKKSLGRFLLHLRGNTNISELQITNTLHMVQDVVRTYVGCALRRVEQNLRQRNVEFNLDVEHEVQSTNCIFNLDSKKKRADYLEKEFKILMPTRYTLGRRFVKYGSASLNEDRPTKKKKDEMMFIPITKTFQKFFANNTFANLFKDNNSQDGIFASVEDGNKYKNENWWKNHKHSIHFKLYCDEVDMCDGLGSKASGEQKLLMFYCTCTDISPEYQPVLLFYFLVAIVKSEDLKRYGINKILRPIVDNLKEFEAGIDVPGEFHIDGGLFAIIGDNLSQQLMCALKESFGRTEHPCRFCLASLQQVHELTEERPDLLRNPIDHDRQVTAINAAEGQEKERLKKLYGINGESILNELQGFHVVTSAPPDIIHDILLGILPRTLQNFAQKVILKKMSLKELNKRIQNFDFGYSEVRYRPTSLKLKHLIPGANIKQTALQMSTLAYLIPYIVRDKVEADCPNFQNYKNLLEITCLVFGYSISSGMLDYLGDSIAEYLHDFAFLYADDDDNDNNDEDDVNKKDFVPKQHFLTHYPHLIREFGPLRNFDCLRPEAKHQQSKRRAQGMRNYKNLPYTLAVRHQYWQTFKLLGTLTKNTTTGPQKLVATETLEFRHLMPQEVLQCTSDWVEFKGVKYIADKCLIAIGYSNRHCTPIFAALHCILVRNEEIIFICKKVKTVDYNTELVAYEVTISEVFISINPNDLQNHEVFHVHKSQNKLFVTVKHSFGDLY